MKLRIYLTENTRGVPFNYASELSLIFHGWTGLESAYDELVLYSVGWLSGRHVEHRPETSRQRREGALFFQGGARWDIGIYDQALAQNLLDRLPQLDMSFYGMQVQQAELIPAPAEAFGMGNHRFLANSPVLLRQFKDDDTDVHLTFRDSESGRIMTDLAHRKADLANLPEEEVKLFFDPNFRNAKTRLIDIRGAKMKASVCPVIVYASPQMLDFIWTVGIGELCGLGFGSLYHTA